MAGRELVVFRRAEDGATRVEVDCGVVAPETVSRRLFGKFTEHLGRNIYNGMWAQILQNSTFGDWSFYKEVRRRADRWRAEGYPIDRVLAACDRGLSCWWTPYGAEEAGYCVDWTDPLNGDTSQRVEVPEGAEETGVEQAVHLPVHRTSAYTLSFHARGTSKALQVSLVGGDKGEVLASARMEGIGSDWRRFEAGLRIPEGAAASGKLVTLRIVS
jgi:alpha-N-arabinofuranosidase